MKKLLLILFLIVLEVFLLFTITLHRSKENNVNYIVTSCGLHENQVAIYDKNTKTMLIFVNVNCCSDSIKVKIKDKTLEIDEIDYDGEICRCFCTKEIKVFDIPEVNKVILRDWTGKEKEIKIEEFCGISTFGKCQTDEDCIKDGCSGEICRSKFEKPVISTCEYKECYDYLRYFSCKCINGKCMWVIS